MLAYSAHVNCLQEERRQWDSLSTILCELLFVKIIKGEETL